MLVGIAAVVLGVLIGRGQTSRSAGGRVDQAAAGISGIRLAVPDFRLTAARFAGGGEFILSQRAANPTILYGMAAWCGSCIGQARTLVQLKRELGDRVNLVVVDIDPNDTEANLDGFARAAGGPLGIWAIDRDGTVTRPYRIAYLHTTIVIRDGQERSRSLTDESLDQLRTAVE